MRTLLSLMCLLSVSFAFAQEYERDDRFSGSLIASFALPTGEFKSVYGKGAIGANVSLMHKIEASNPFMFGIEVAYHYMDGDTYYGSSSVGSYEKTATTNFVSIFPKLRIQHPGNLAVSPFAEGLMGANFFYSHEKIVSNSSWNGEMIDRKIVDLSVRPGFGVAAGFDIPISKKGERLEIKSTYFLGGKTRYYGDANYSNSGQISFTSMKSRTDMLMFQVGINL